MDKKKEIFFVIVKLFNINKEVHTHTSKKYLSLMRWKLIILLLHWLVWCMWMLLMLRLARYW